MMERIRSLYEFTTDGLKIEQLNEEINNLAGIDMSAIMIISLVIHILPLKNGLVTVLNIRN